MQNLKVGEIWSFKGKHQDYFLHILRIEDGIVHIAILDDRYNYIIKHMPFDKDIITSNVLKKYKISYAFPKYEEGYKYWKDAYENNNAGIYHIDVSDAIDL